MAKPRVIEEEAPTSLLPLSPAVVEHHLQTLMGPMREWKAQGRVPPVLLLTGVTGLGKREICHYLSQWIFCEKSGFGVSSADAEEPTFDLFAAPGAAEPEPALAAVSPREIPVRPCGECASCQRALHGTWVDFREIKSEDDDEGGALKIQQFRELKASLGFGAHEGGYRVILIPDADRMAAQAANSVLKLLEEPPRGWVFLLTASDPTLILPTVLSRCQTLRLRPFHEAALESALRDEGVDASRARMAARLAQGSWGKARSLAQPETWDHRRAVVQFVKAPAATFTDLVDWAASETANLELLLDTLENLLADLMLWSVSPQHAWRNADAGTELAHHSAAALKKLGGSVERARAFWASRAEHVSEVRRRMSAPLNRKLLVQDLLIPWVEMAVPSS